MTSARPSPPAAVDVPPRVKDARRAVLLGVTNTSAATNFPPLLGAEADVAAMKRVLQVHRDSDTENFAVDDRVVDTSSGWEVGELLSSIELALEDANHFLFYFSGHGAVTNFGLQLVTPDKEHALDAGVYFDTLLHRFNRAPRETEITVILDCCFAGSAGDSSLDGAEVGASFDRDVLRRFTHLRDGITILASSDWDERSYTRREGLSDFTKELTACLWQPRPATDVLDLYKWAKERVPQQAPVLRTFGSTHSAIRVDDEEAAVRLGLLQARSDSSGAEYGGSTDL